MIAYFTCAACLKQGQAECDGYEFAAAAARKGGWHMEQGYIYCPDCKAANVPNIPNTSNIGGRVVS